MKDFGQERFLVEHPIKSFATGNYSKVPVLLGITEDEFAGLAFNVLSNSTLTNEMNEQWNHVAPIAFQYERSTDNSRRISAALKAHYFQNRPIGNETLTALGELYADALIGFGVHRTVKLFARTNPSNTFYYKFSYRGRYSHVYMPDSNGTVPFGVVHHDDLIYLFYAQKLFPFIRDIDPEVRMVEKLTLMWTNFARFGNPTPKNDSQLDNVKWPTYDLANSRYLDINTKLTTDEKLYENRFQQWEKLFPLERYL